MVSCSMRYSVSPATSSVAIDWSSSLRMCSGQGIGGGAVAGEVDGGVFVELREPVVGLDHADGARLGPHDDRLGGAAAGGVLHAVEQVSGGDTRGAEEDVFTGHQVLGGQYLIDVVAGVDGLLVFLVVPRGQLRLDGAAHAAERRGG